MADKINELEQDWQDALYEEIVNHPVSVQVINDTVLPDGRLIKAGTYKTNNKGYILEPTVSPNNVIVFPGNNNTIFTGV